LEHPKDGEQTTHACDGRRHQPAPFPSADRITPKSTNNTASAAMDTMVSGIASVRMSK